MIDMRSLLKCKTQPEFNQVFNKLFRYDNGTWKNLKGITDKHELRQYEYENTAWQTGDLLMYHPKIKSTSDLFKIHRYLFKDVYPWAGQWRVYSIAKHHHLFCRVKDFPKEIDKIEQHLHQLNQKDKLDPKDYASLLTEINFLHLFPEGNGRSTNAFLQCLAENHGQQLNYDRHQKDLVQALNNKNIDQIANHLQVTNSQQTPHTSTQFQSDDELLL